MAPTERSKLGGCERSSWTAAPPTSCGIRDYRRSMTQSTLRTLIHVCVLLFAPTTAAAQWLEVGLHAGYFLPTVEQFERAVLRPTATGFRVDHYEGHHEAGLSLGATVTAWPLPHVGLDLAGGLRFCDRSGSSPFVIDPFLPAPAGRRAALSVLTLRLVGRARSGGTNVRLGAGPALVHIAGSAYDGGSPEIRLAKQTSSGGTIAVDVTRTLGRIRLRFGVEDAIYRAAMERLPPGDTTRTPVQHDVALNVGIALPLR